MARYAITIFLSAFLLFQVQPLVGKFILPWFGGSPAVWTTCMLFFQVVLLGGYAYAHWTTSRLSLRAQTICHLALLALSLAFMPLARGAEAWKPLGDESPIGQILLLLAATIGLPYFLLSSTGPLLQEAFRRETLRTPYRLYSLSNIGSLLALLTYPFVVEPALTLRVQTWVWSAGYGLFVLCCGWCAFLFSRVASASAISAADQLVADTGTLASEKGPTTGRIVVWLLLAACGSMMLLATTNQLCQEVSSVPFLWIMPLALYLLSFIICFDQERWYHRSVFRVLLFGAIVAAGYAIFAGTGLDLWKQLAIYSSVLWVTCMVCHGELVQCKPAPRYATLFYLVVSAGGAVGGILVAVVAPLVLQGYWEYEIALAGTLILSLIAPQFQTVPTTEESLARWLAISFASLIFGGAAAWGILEYREGPASTEKNLETTRNFYGVLRVNSDENVYDAKYNDPNGPYRELIHGRIQHGFQYTNADKRSMPTTYYGLQSGVGIALKSHPRRGAGNAADRTLTIGVVGLGCGTLATYGQPGDSIRFYEINPEVIRISDEYFTYRKDSKADLTIILGDARIKMERELEAEAAQDFDVLAVDAFSSDSIPMHLLTRQCVELFEGHMKPDGLLCLHISNSFLNLSGVTRGIAESLDYECVRFETNRDPEIGVNHSTWVILTKNREFLDAPAVRQHIKPWTQEDPAPLVWTDDYGSLWQVLD